MKELKLCSKCHTMKNIEGFNDCARCMEKRSTMTTENWREEFDEYFKGNTDEDFVIHCKRNYIKEYISTLLSKERNKVLDEVKREVEKKNWGALYIEGELKPIAGDISTIIDSL